jgi:protein-tyrosine phosphatase
MIRAGHRAGLAVEGQGRQVTTAADMEGYDLILAMDRFNLRQLQQMAPLLSDRIHLYRSFDAEADSDEMPDPYGLSDSEFDLTVRRARAGARAVVSAIKSGLLP